VDIGINLTSPKFSNEVDRIVNRSFEASVNTLVITGTSISNSQRALDLCEHYKERFPNSFYFTAGVHPHDAKSCNDKTLDSIRALARHQEMVAVGECGLDFDRNFSPPLVQEKWFDEQIKLAIELDRPLFLHERSASERFIELLKPHRDNLKRGGVVHCFTGTSKELKAYLALDMHIGITGWITDPRRGKTLKELVKLIPLDRLMIETDAPFLTPFNMDASGAGGRPKKNEPAYLTYVLKEVAACVGLSEEEVARETTATAKRFFQLPE